MTRHLVILAKAPRLGRVKTRLARDIGTVPAWMFYRRTLASLIRRLANDPRWQTWIYLDGAGYRPVGTIKVRAQKRGDLGTRMMQPMHELPPGPVVLIGGDIPDVTPRHIARAFDKLRHHRVAFGPAQDGGFWLLGMARSPRLTNPFTGVTWSRPDTLTQCLNNCEGAGLTDELSDVDDGKGYRARGPWGDPEGRARG